MNDYNDYWLLETEAQEGVLLTVLLASATHFVPWGTGLVFVSLFTVKS